MTRSSRSHQDYIVPSRRQFSEKEQTPLSPTKPTFDPWDTVSTTAIFRPLGSISRDVGRPGLARTRYIRVYNGFRRRQKAVRYDGGQNTDNLFFMSNFIKIISQVFLPLPRLYTTEVVQQNQMKHITF